MNFKRVIRDHTGEISSLYFIKNDHILVTASHDSSLNLYDEEDPDVTPRLRRLGGVHPGSEVTALEYSEHLSLIATGATNGIIFIWDFEMSRLEGACINHTREILSLKFLAPYPILVSSSADGYICIWGVRGCHLDHRYSCIAKLMNIFTTDAGYASLNVPAMITFVGKFPEIFDNI